LKETAKLGLRDPKSGATMSVEAAPVTAENRDRIWRANNVAERDESDSFPQFDPSSGKGPDNPPRLEEDGHQGHSLSLEQARHDLDQLRGHLLDQFSYLRLSNVDVDPEVDAIKSSLDEPVNSKALAVRIHRMICKFGDAHAGVSGIEPMLPGGFLPFLARDADGRVVAFNEDRSALVEADHPYIRSMDGQQVEQWLELARSITPAGSRQLQRSRAIRNLRLINFLRAEATLPEEPTIDLELESADRSSVRTLSLPLSPSKPMYGEWPRTDSGVLEHNIGYLRLGRMDDDAAAHALQMMRKFRTTDGLVIDVRGNGGGSRGALQALFPYFMPPGSAPIVANVAAYRLSEDFQSDHLAARDLYRAEDARWDERERQAIERVARSFTPQWRPPRDEFSDWHYFVLDRPLNDADLYHYDRPVVILMNEECFSATDIFLGAFKTAAFSNVQLLGTPSGGGSGRKQSVHLNNSGIVIELSSMISFLPNGEMYDRNGIQPDVIVKPIATDFVGQTDSALDEAITLLRK
jgi:hypothetical protein